MAGTYAPSTATFARGDVSVTMDIVAEGGSLGIAWDVGKPKMTVHEVGRRGAPRTMDMWSARETYTILGILRDARAYQDAIELYDLFVTHSKGDQMTMVLTGTGMWDGEYDVAPVGGDAVSMTYPAGARNWVAVQLQVVVVSRTFGSGGDVGYVPPLITGRGRPTTVTLSNDSTALELGTNVEVERRGGRSNANLKETPAVSPNYHDTNRAGSDVFTLSAVVYPDSIGMTDTELKGAIDGLLRDPLGWESLILDFGNTYALGAYTVAPTPSSSSLRVSKLAGGRDAYYIDNLALRVVANEYSEAEI